jgi:hypothetical protein
MRWDYVDQRITVAIRMPIDGLSKGRYTHKSILDNGVKIKDLTTSFY